MRSTTLDFRFSICVDDDICQYKIWSVPRLGPVHLSPIQQERKWIDLTIADLWDCCRGRAGQLLPVFSLSLLTVPEVFANVNSAQFLLVSNVA